MKNLFTILTLLTISISVFSQSWDKIYPYNPPQTYGYPSYSFWDANNLWLTNHANGILTTRRSFDGGNTWVQTSASGFSTNSPGKFAAVNNTTASMVVQEVGGTSQYALYYTTDGGNSWTKKFNVTSLRFVHFFNNSLGVAVADSPYIGAGHNVYSTTDGGISWTQLPNGNGPVSSGSASPNYKVRDNVLYYWMSLYSGGFKLRLVKSTDYGVTRTLLPKIFNDFSLMTWKNANEGIVLEHTASYSTGNPITINRTTDGGVTWSVITNAPSGLPIPFSGGIEYIPGTDYLLATGPSDATQTSQKGTWISDDHGVTWTAIDQGIYHQTIHCVDNQNCYSFGWNQTEGVFLFKLNFAGLGTSEVASQLAGIYPNPTKGEVFIKTDKKIKLSTVLDMTGKVLLTESSKKLDISSLNNGVYLLIVKFENGKIHAEKIIKK